MSQTIEIIRKGVPIRYSPEEIQFLSDNRHLTGKELTQLFNQTFNRGLKPRNLRDKCVRHGFLSGRTGRFENGHKAWNKGTKGIMPKPKNSFKKGELPCKHKPVGTTRFVERENCLYIKVAEPKYWMPYSRFVWEQHHGEIPKGYILFHKDGNSLNDNIENLALRSRAELLIMNKLKYKQHSDELKPTIDLLARNLAKASEIQKQLLFKPISTNKSKG